MRRGGLRPSLVHGYRDLRCDASSQVASRVSPLISRSSQAVTVIDGASNSTTTVSVGNSPTCVAVNPVTNKTYVANYRNDSVTVIDGTTNFTTTITRRQDRTRVRWR